MISAPEDSSRRAQGTDLRRVLLLVALGVGVLLAALVAGTGTSHAASSANHLTVSTSATQPTRTTVQTTARIVWKVARTTKTRTVTVRVTAAAKARAPWRSGARKITLTWSDGAYRGKVKVTSTHRPRIVVSATNGKKTSRTVVRGAKAPGKLTTAGSATRVKGAKLKVAATVQPAYARKVTLQQKVGSAWRTVSTAKASGARSRTIKVAVPATDLGTSKWRLVSAKTTRVVQRTKAFTVTTVAPAATTITGAPASLDATATSPGTLSLSVSPAYGRTLQLQERSPVTGAWQDRKSVTLPLAKKGQVTLTLPVRPAGTAQWRVQVAKTTGLYAAATASVAVRTTLGTGPLLDVTSLSQAQSEGLPLVIAHRGGAARYPEASREAYEAAVSSGFAIEADLHPLEDGTLVVVHDSTTARTLLDAAGNAVDADVSSLTLDRWNALRVAPAYPGGPTGTPMTWDELLSTFGGRAVVVVEVKEASSVAQVVADVVAAGMTDDVVLQSSSAAATANIQAAAAQLGAGDIRVRRLLAASFFSGLPGTVTTGLDALFATDGGPLLLGATLTNTATWVLPYLQGNPEAAASVIPYSVKNASQVAGLLASGRLAGFSSDDPWAVWGGLPADG